MVYYRAVQLAENFGRFGFFSAANLAPRVRKRTGSFGCSRIVSLSLSCVQNDLLFEDDFEIKPKYYSSNHFLFLTRVMSLQEYASY